MGLSWRKEKSRRIAQCIDRGMHLGAQAVSAASEGLLIRPPPFCTSAVLMGARDGGDRSSRTRCPRPVPRPQTPVAKNRCRSSANAECAQRENHQSAPANPAKEFLPDNGTAWHPRTVGRLLPWLRAALPDPVASL